MVYYFKARPDAGDYTIFMGLDKHENEELIKYGFPEDIWYLLFFNILVSNWRNYVELLMFVSFMFDFSCFRIFF